MGNAYDYSAILNHGRPPDYTSLDRLMIEIKKLAQMRGCSVRYTFAGGYCIYDAIAPDSACPFKDKLKKELEQRLKVIP